MLSISSDSEDTDYADAGGPGSQIFKRVLRSLVLLAQAEAADTDSSARQRGSGNPPSRSQSSAATTDRTGSPPRIPTLKHKLPYDGGDEDGQEDRDRRSSKKSKHEGPEGLGRPKYLACPFWKLDPSKYWNCFSKELRETRNIKQHLQRRHSPIYCEKCLTIFGNE